MIQNPVRDFPIAKPDGVAQDRFIGWIESVTAAINLLTPIDGTGSPEGVVYAPQKASFFDTVAEEEYIKTTNETSNTGWVQIT